MNFFEAQDSARRSTFWLVVLFCLAVAGLIILTNLLVLVAMVFASGGSEYVGAVDIQNHFTNTSGNSSSSVLLSYFSWDIFIAVSAGVCLLVFAGSAYKTMQLSGGGRVVAELMGGNLLAQNSNDPMERKILNVVEEMAIASGVPVPSVYLLDETGINAFAAGLSSNDAVIGVTRGAVTYLSRDELQGVIAHEFSHIVNGDMRLNLRLTSVLHGILLLGIIGYYMVRALRYARGSRSDKAGSAIAAIFMLGLGMIVIGYVGSFFGQWIKAMVSRHREYLADASSVQFTRNPDGIAGALKKIGGLYAGSKLNSAAAPEYSHSFFSQGVSSFQSIFATHPPLKTRIKRVDSHWDGEYIVPESLMPPATETESGTEAGGGFPMHNTGKAAVIAAAAAEAIAAIEKIGETSEADLGYARDLLGQIPEAIRLEAKDPYGVRALIYFMLLDGNPEIRSAQQQLLRENADPAVQEKVVGFEQFANDFDRSLRLPVLDLAMPALRELSMSQYKTFRQNLHALIQADNKIDMEEWIIQRLVMHRLDEFHGLRKHPLPKYGSLAALKNACAVLLSIVAYVEYNDHTSARLAFDVAKEELGIGDLVIQPTDALSIRTLNAAVDSLEQLKPLVKPRLLKACAACISAQGHISASGVELVRAIASSLDCPMPSLHTR